MWFHDFLEAHTYSYSKFCETGSGISMIRQFPEFFNLIFWRVFVSWPNCVAAAAVVYAKTSDAVVGSRKEGSQLADDDIFCSSFYEMPARGQLLASLLQPTVDSTCCSFRPQSSLPHACKISENVDQNCRFKVFFLGRPSSVTASLKKVPSKLLIGDWVLRSA